MRLLSREWGTELTADDGSVTVMACDTRSLARYRAKWHMVNSLYGRPRTVKTRVVRRSYYVGPWETTK